MQALEQNIYIYIKGPCLYCDVLQYFDVKGTVVCQFYHNKLEYNQETKATATPTAKVT